MSLGLNGPEDVERLLDRVTSRRASDALRGAVLAAVAQELSVARPVVRWERRLAWSAAGLLVTAIAFNAAVSYSGESRLDALFAPDPGSNGGMARTRASLVDDRAARRVAPQMLTMTAAVTTPSIRDPQVHCFWQLLTEWTLHGGDWVNAQSLESTPPDRRRSGDSDRGALNDRGYSQLAGECPA